MTFWFVRGLLRRVVTTRYPARPEPSVAALPTPPVLRADLLSVSLVDALIEVCPSRAFRHEGQMLVYDVGACTACGRCYPVAGAAARPSGVLELAATARDQLVKRVRIADDEAVIR
jgi:ferredoxin